jgi:tetratricopeptide (TPR) repeat protein
MTRAIPLDDALATARQALVVGDTHLGIQSGLHALTLARDQGDEAAAAAAGTVLAHHLFNAGHFEDALYYGQRALSTWQRMRDHDHVCEVLVMLASACSDIGVDNEALEFAQQAFEIARARALPQRLNQALSLLGALHGRLGEWDRGETLMLQALSRARDHHDEVAVLVALNGLMALLVDMHAALGEAGDPERAVAAAQRALRHARHALVLAQDQPNLVRRITVRSNAAGSMLANDRAADALAMLRECREAALADEQRPLALKAWTGEARALLRLGRHVEASVALDEVFNRLKDTDHPKAFIDALRLRLTLAELRGDMALVDRCSADLALRVLRQQHKADALCEALQEAADRVQVALRQVESDWLDIQRNGARTTH